MPVRVDRDSIKLMETKDPSIFEVEAIVTTDAVGVQDPTLQTVRTKWNKNTGDAGLRAVLEKAVPTTTEKDTLESTLKTNVGETLVQEPVVEPSPDPDYTINATNVTVNQVVQK